MPQDSMSTWEDVCQNFLSRFYPPAKTARKRNEILTFYQVDGETLYEAWERFNELLRKCPHHQIAKQNLVQNFYNGLLYTTRTLIDAAAGGAFMRKTRDEAWDLLENMAMNNFQWANEKSIPKKATVNEVDVISTLAAQVQSLVEMQAKQSQMLAQLLKVKAVQVNAVQETCEFCGGQHSSDEC